MNALERALHEASRLLRLDARGMLSEAGLAHHRRRRLGQSRVFFEHRAYTRGDDVRSLDWRAFARTGRPMIKRFEDEGQLQLLLAIDTSSSLDYGEGRERKSWPLHRLAQALTELALAQNDAVGLWWLGQPQRLLAPRAHRQMAQAMASALTRAVPSESATANATTPTWPLRNRKPHRIVLMGDWLHDWVDGAERLPRLLQMLRARGHVTHLVHVMHPDEVTFPFEGTQGFVGTAAHAARWTRAETARTAYLQHFSDFCARLEKMCSQHQAHYLPLQSDCSIAPVLQRLARGV